MKPNAIEMPLKTRVRFVSGRTRILAVTPQQFESAIVESTQKGLSWVALPHVRGKIILQLGSIETFEQSIAGDTEE